MTERGELFMWLLNTALTILFIAGLLLAVNQRFFEKNKCEEWVKDKIFQVQAGEGIGNCTINCDTISMTSPENFADKSSKLNLTLYGNKTIPIY